MNDEFLRRVHSVLLEAASSYPSGIKGAVVGTLLRARGIDPAAHGYQKIRDLMEALELAGKVKTGADGKLAYTVWVKEDGQSRPPSFIARKPQLPVAPQVGRPLDDPDSVAVGHRMLRQHVYDAFINERLDRPRRFGISSGAIWIGDVPQPATDKKWVNIEPIAAKEQQGWGLRFLVQKGWESENELIDALRGEDWYRAFPLALASTHGETARAEWNRRRTARVVRIVDAWAADHEIPAEILFEGDGSIVHRTTPSDARKRILAVLSRLPTTELLKLPIPARYWLSAESTEPDQPERR